jgi:hypothetical protein
MIKAMMVSPFRVSPEDGISHDQAESGGLIILRDLVQAGKMIPSSIGATLERGPFGHPACGRRHARGKVVIR